MYHDKQRRFRTDSIVEDLGPYHSVEAKFTAEIYDGEALDTSVELVLHGGYTITWKDREKLMKDLQKVLKKYII